MANPADDAGTATRESPDWTNEFFGALSSLGSVYIKSRYGQNDAQYVKGADGNLYPAGQPIINQPQPSAGVPMGTLLLIGGAVLVAVLLVAD